MALRLLQSFSQVFLLVLFYYIGILVQETFHLIIPGSLIGMALVFLFLLTGIIKINWIEQGSNVILKWMPLFFVPVTVGIMEYKSYILERGWLLIIVVIISTFITFLISAKIAEITEKKGKEVSEE